MIYLGNGMYSDSSLSHGGPWKNHKYIRIENGRYIYPGDIGGNKGKINWGAGSGSNPSNNKANNAFRRDTVLAAKPNKKTAYRKVNVGSAHDIYKPTPFTGERESAGAYKAQSANGANSHYHNNFTPNPNGEMMTQDEINKILDMQDRNGTSVKTETNGQRGAPPPEIKYKEGRDRHNNRKQEKRLQYTDKYQSGVNSQGPSAAERAQRYYGSNASKNTSSGSNSVKYKKTKDINKNRKYQKSVSSQGPSAAERAQTTRYYSSKINGKWDTPPEAESNNIHGTTRQRMVSYNNKPKGPSAAEKAQRNANGGSRNVEKKPKKKKSVKSAVKSWVKKNIIGAPGKVTTHN